MLHYRLITVFVTVALPAMVLQGEQLEPHGGPSMRDVFRELLMVLVGQVTS